MNIFCNLFTFFFFLIHFSQSQKSTLLSYGHFVHQSCSKKKWSIYFIAVSHEYFRDPSEKVHRHVVHRTGTEQQGSPTKFDTFMAGHSNKKKKKIKITFFDGSAGHRLITAVQFPNIALFAAGCMCVWESARAVLQNVVFLPLPFEWNLWPAVRNDQCCPPTCSVLNPWFKTWNGLDLFGQVWTRPTLCRRRANMGSVNMHQTALPPLPPSVRPPLRVCVDLDCTFAKELPLLPPCCRCNVYSLISMYWRGQIYF